MTLNKENYLTKFLKTIELLMNNIEKEIFYDYEKLFNVIEIEEIKSLSLKERVIFIWFMMENGLHINFKDKNFISEFLEYIQFNLSNDNDVNIGTGCFFDTHELIDFLKVNLAEEDFYNELNKALVRTNKNIIRSFPIIYLKKMDIKGQEDKFDVINLLKSIQEFITSKDTENKDRMLLEIKENFDQTVIEKLYSILLKNEDYANKGIEKMTFINPQFKNRFQIIEYKKTDNKKMESILKELDGFDVSTLFLFFNNKQLLNDLIKLKNVNEHLVVINKTLKDYPYNNKEIFDYLFSLMQETGIFVLAPYEYIMKNLNKRQREKYLERMRKIKDLKAISFILGELLNPKTLIEIKLILSGFEVGDLTSLDFFYNENNPEEISFFTTLLNSLNTELTVPESTLKTLEMNFSV